MKSYRVFIVLGAFLSVSTLALAQTIGVIGTPAATVATPVMQGIPWGATIPRVVSSVPVNMDTKVNATLTLIKINFDQAMDVASFYWPIPKDNPSFPYVTGDPYWTSGNKTVNLPVKLVPNCLYRIPLNDINQLIFRSAAGVALNPGMISFQTSLANTGAAASSNMFPGYTPAPFHATTNTPIPGQGGALNPMAGAGAGLGAAGLGTTGYAPQTLTPAQASGPPKSKSNYPVPAGWQTGIPNVQQPQGNMPQGVKAPKSNFQRISGQVTPTPTPTATPTPRKKTR
ncbi:MAG: Ig-like domain-containing protein [bacterium]